MGAESQTGSESSQAAQSRVVRAKQSRPVRDLLAWTVKPRALFILLICLLPFALPSLSPSLPFPLSAILSQVVTAFRLYL